MDFLWEISDKLQPYAGHVSAFAMVVTVAQMLTPALLINEIRKAKSAEKFPVAPFLGGFVLSVLFVIFGQIISCSTTIKVNLIGVSLNMVSARRKIPEKSQVDPETLFACALIRSM